MCIRDRSRPSPRVPPRSPAATVAFTLRAAAASQLTVYETPRGRSVVAGAGNLRARSRGGRCCVQHTVDEAPPGQPAVP
eukprot:9370124-Alexandrium_andersonii.AAC.1